LLDTLPGDLAERSASELIEIRWHCHQVFAAVGDARAAPLLRQLGADGQQYVVSLAGEGGRDRLIEALPICRGIDGACRGAA
jgi:hypothetical protein